MNRRKFLQALGLSGVGLVALVIPNLPKGEPLKSIPATFNNKQSNIYMWLADDKGNRIELPTLLQTNTSYFMVVESKK